MYSQHFPIGPRIKEERLKHHLTQEQLAELSNVPTTYISRVESSPDYNITLHRLINICNALNITMAQLFNDDYHDERYNKLPVAAQKLIQIIFELNSTELNKVSVALIPAIKEIIRLTNPQRSR